MNSRRRRASRDGSHIQHKVAKLAEEHICRSPALSTARLILVTIDESETLETWCCLEHRHGVRVADQLRIVVVDDRGGDDVSTRWEVDHCRGRCRGLAAVNAVVSQA